VSRAKAWFLGGGPGAGDLLTVRAAGAIAEADIVIWGERLVMEEAVTANARPEAELMPWPPATMEELLGAYERARQEDLVVARLIGGDPAVYVDMGEELAKVRELGLPHEIVPGVGALSAAGALLGRELARAHSEQQLAIVSTRGELERLGGDEVTMAIYMSGREGEGLPLRLEAAGYGPGTPCAIVGSASWPQQEVVRCPLEELEEQLADERFERRTLVLVGPGVGGA
jgi:precorrin-4/cobalt-precorrin-4 C11-methyltransferase